MGWRMAGGGAVSLFYRADIRALGNHSEGFNMNEFTTFQFILDGDGWTEDDARDCALGMAWMEIETSRQTIHYHRHIGTWNGVDVYYDYGADYFFFCPAEAPVVTRA